MTNSSDRRALSPRDYWRANLTYVGALMAVWFVISYGAGILFVEPLNRFETYFLNTAADAKKFVLEVDHPSIGILFDTFHANLEEKDVAQAILSCNFLITHVHISENDRGIPGTGFPRDRPRFWR